MVCKVACHETLTPPQHTPPPQHPPPTPPHTHTPHPSNTPHTPPTPTPNTHHPTSNPSTPTPLPRHYSGNNDNYIALKYFLTPVNQRQVVSDVKQTISFCCQSRCSPEFPGASGIEQRGKLLLGSPHTSGGSWGLHIQMVKKRNSC